MSWWKPRSSENSEERSESTTSHERPLPRDEDNHIVTERTRLLGHDIEPDVQPSPYNLVVVRSLRNISISQTSKFRTPPIIAAGIFLTLVTMAWWIVLFVSVSVNVPGLYTRGSGFTVLAYAFLTIFALINSIIFFATPLPQGVNTLSLTLSVFLFVNAIIILLSAPSATTKVGSVSRPSSGPVSLAESGP